jgi:hypothetical protein
MIKTDSRSENKFEFIRNLMIQHCFKQQIIDCLADIKNEASNLLEQISMQNIF